MYAAGTEEWSVKIVRLGTAVEGLTTRSDVVCGMIKRSGALRAHTMARTGDDKHSSWS